MELEVFWSEFATNKLEDIFDYYKKKVSLKVAQNIVNGVVDQTINLEKNPKIGQVEEVLKDDDREFRYLIYTNYKIVYYTNLTTHQVIIANIFDVRQNPNKLKLI